jgi:hypothetical protein
MGLEIEPGEKLVLGPLCTSIGFGELRRGCVTSPGRLERVGQLQGFSLPFFW